MKLKYEKGQLCFSLHELLEGIDAEMKKNISMALALDDQVIEYVTQQIIDGMTEDGSHAGVMVTATATAYHGLDKARRNVAKASGDVAKREIERLEEALLIATRDLQNLRNEIYNQSHR